MFINKFRKSQIIDLEKIIDCINLTIIWLKTEIWLKYICHAYLI